VYTFVVCPETTEQFASVLGLDTPDALHEYQAYVTAPEKFAHVPEVSKSRSPDE
jgi:hypothetical protein